MKFDWKNWNLGGKIIFLTACASTLSMFMNWVDIGIASQTGLSQMAFLFLALYVYPVLILFKNKPMNKIWGLVCSILSVVLTIAYISSKSIEIFDSSVNAAATGAWLFLLSSIALIFGVIKYRPSTANENHAEQDSGTDTQ